MDFETQPTTICSLQNPRVKAVIKLRDARTRRKTGEFLIDGNREIAWAAAAGFELSTVFVEAGRKVPAELTELSLAFQPVSRAVLEKLSYGERGASPVAVARVPPLPLAALKLAPSSLLLVLDRIEKPGNLGACLRTAAACGADAVVLTNPVCDVFNPNTIRASRGSVFTIPMAVALASEFVDFARSKRLQILTARVDGEQSLWDCDFRGASAIVFGSEAEGLGDEWRASPCQSFQIPMSARADSLNVSISAAVSLYEALRQRRAPKFDR